MPSVRRSTRAALAALALLLAAVQVACTGDPDGSNEEAGVAERIGDIVESQLALDQKFEAVDSVLVLQHGDVVYETYPGSSPGDHHNVWSVTKSVLGTLIGIAVSEGLIDGVDATLAELLPERADEMTPAVAGTTLRQVLTMTGGFIGGIDLSFNEVADPVAMILGDQVTPPGRAFTYSNEGSHLLSAVLAEATGGTVLDYARSKLFDPLGIDTEPAAEPVSVPRNTKAYDAAAFAWPVDRTGLHLGWGLLKLTSEDMARLGSLYLDRGRWDGQQVVPEAWVDEATAPQVGTDSPPDHYGYQWWVRDADGHEAFMAVGYGGQLIRVVPDVDAVVVVTVDTDIGDPNSRGISTSSLLYIVDDLVVPELEG